MAFRQWADTETTKLLDLIVSNYAFLFEAFTPSRSKQMVDQKWVDIASNINSLGAGFPALSAGLELSIGTALSVK